MRNYFLLFFTLVVFLPGVLALSFSSGPSVYADASNITTTDPFACRFTPSGSGSLTANITWFRDGSSYTGSDQSTSVTDGVQTTSTQVASGATTKDEVWLCQVTLSNTTTILVQNSSSITIRNTLPTIIEPGQLIFYEDTPAIFTFTANDDDGDTIVWSSLDLDRGSYSNQELFIIASNGSVTIDESDEDIVGNHTMQISAFDEGTGPGAEGTTIILEFQLVANNDAPVFTGGLNYSCNEGSTCSGQVLATDEDNSTDELTFTFNESFISPSSDGSFSFVPTFAQALVQNYTIQVNVTDGNSTVTTFMYLTLSAQNQVPNVTYVDVAGTQNDALYTFYFNVTDTLDVNDAFNFSIAPQSSGTCPNNPWVILNYTNGLGGNVASGLINTSLDSNDYVVCRDVTITVYEIDTTTGNPRDTYTYDITLNITNVNDAPVLHELNYDEEQQNMSELTAALGLSFSYTVNATDVDQDTYEGDTLSYALANVPVFSNGSALFVINSATGEVTSVQSQMNATYSGTHNFTVIVYDSLTPQLNDSRNLTVTISVNDPPVLNSLDTSTCFDNFTCYKTISGNDTEGATLLISLSSLQITNPLSTVTTYTNATQIADLLGFNTTGVFVANTTTFSFNFTPDDVDRGDYVLNFTLADTVGNIITNQLNFTVNNTLEAPLFDNDADHSTYNAVTFTSFYETILFYKQIFMDDDDLLYAEENITFSYVFNGASPLGMTFTQINNTLVVINYTPDNTQSGSYSVNLTATDTNGLSTTQTVAFTIADTSAFPNITQVRPYYNTTSQTTITNALVTILDTDNITSVTVAENDTVIFDLRAVDGDNLNMLVRWYVNGTLNSSIAYVAATPDHDYTRTFGFFDEGTYNVTARVSDIGYDEYTWIVTVNNTNRPPRLINSARNLTGASAIQSSGQVLFNNFFFLNWDENVVFYDPDDDINGNGELDYNLNETNNLTFAINTSGTCDELATFTFPNTNDNLTVTLLASGTCSTTFTATDPYGAAVSSNEIVIQIIQTESSSSSSSSTSSRTRTVTETVTVPVEDPVDVPVEVDILYPDAAVTYANNTAIVPITVRNNWDEELTGITLSLNDSTGALSYVYSQSYIPLLPVDQEIRLNLSLTGYRANEPFSFNITAFIGSLQYTDYETIHINALERGQEDIEAIKSRIGFARDLLRDNPECGELLEVIEEAEKNPEASSIQVLNNVINGCKYLISEGYSRNDTFPKSFSGKLSVYGKTLLDYNLLFLIVGSLLGVALVVGILIRVSMKKI